MNAHHFAEYILNNKGTYFPPLQDLEKEEEADDVAGVRARLRELERRYCDDLEMLYHAQAAGYLAEAQDRYLAKDALVYLVQGENNPTAVASYAKLGSLYRGSRRPGVYTHEWDEQLYAVRMAHYKQMLPLRRRLAALEMQARDPRSAYSWKAQL